MEDRKRRKGMKEQEIMAELIHSISSLSKEERSPFESSDEEVGVGAFEVQCSDVDDHVYVPSDCDETSS